jgi:CheY-like chemotaxis protein
MFRLFSSLDTIVLTEKKSNLVAGSLVLVVEDDRELAEKIRLELQAGGHTVQVAETLTKGLRAARSSDAAVLVIDRVLHREDGLSIVEVLRGEGKSTPILVISGPTSVDERIAGFKAGCDDYLVKPFDVRELTARVEALLRRGNESAIRLARISHRRGLVFRAPTMIAQWPWRGRARPWRGLRGWGRSFGGLRWVVGWIAAFFRRRGDASGGCDEAGGGQPPFVGVGTG